MIIENVRVKSIRSEFDDESEKNKFQLIFAIDDKKKRKELIGMIDADWDDNKPKSAKKPDHMAYFKSVPNEEYPDDEDTGTVIFIAKSNQIVQGKARTLRLVQPDGKNYAADNLPNIGRGTIGNLSTSTYTYDNESTGTKLNFNAFQVVDLVEYEGADSFSAITKELTDHDFTELDTAIADGDKKLAKKLFEALKEDGADSKGLKTRKKLLKAL